MYTTARIYYTIEMGVMELRNDYPCYWAGAMSGKEFSRLEDASKAAHELGPWWRVIEHVETQKVVEKSPEYSRCSLPAAADGE